MKILVINCGSSSAKYELFNIDHRRSEVIYKDKVERLTRYADYSKAIEEIRDRLVLRASRKIIGHISDIKGIGHRVVHGGEEFKRSIVITRKVAKNIDKFSKLAPLHNPPSLAGIKACFKAFPGTPQVAVFDTAFHQTMPEHSYIYGIPFNFYKKDGIRRYGFHGTSHRYVASKTAEKLKRPLSKLKIITVHLGNGCSMAAVSRGRSIDTTMGFTPLEGLMMGTRSGDLDPAIITYLMEKKKIGIKKINEILNKKSGLLGVSGISNDMRDILRHLKKGNKRCKLAFKIFFYRIKKYIGAYAAAMGGLDAVVFTAGIGEKVPAIRKKMQDDFGLLFGKKVEFLIIPTNEELLIAKDTYRLVKEKR